LIVATDLEGVLIPELWVEIAEHYNIDGLRVTTREIPDFQELMEHRVEVLQKEDIRLPELQEVTQRTMAFAGALEFLAWARRQGQVMIISDTFHELSDPLIWEMGGYNLYANRFTVDRRGRITGFKLRIRGMKWRVLAKLGEIGFYIMALGDSYNDLSMLHRADHPLLFNPPESLVQENPEIPVVSSYDEIRESIMNLPDLKETSP
jgi:phosphoserine/homoserine phosphotransferase